MELSHPAHQMTLAGGVVVESPRNTPVLADVDVLVCGGGPAGIGAAMAAASCGARTMLLERHGMLGGVWTAGLLNPFFEAGTQGWLVDELVGRLRGAGAWHEWKSWAPTFSTETMKLLLEERFTALGIRWLYQVQIADTVVEDGRVRGVIAEGKGGRFAVLATPPSTPPEMATSRPELGRASVSAGRVMADSNR